MNTWPRLRGGDFEADSAALDQTIDALLDALEDDSEHRFGGMEIDYDENRVVFVWRGPVPEDVRSLVDRVREPGQEFKFVDGGGPGRLFRAGEELAWRFDRAGIDSGAFGPSGKKRTLSIEVARQDDEQRKLAHKIASDLETKRGVVVHIVWLERLAPPVVAPLAPWRPRDKRDWD